METLHIIDASSFIYRSFFALPPLSTKGGFPTGAVYGFLRCLLSIMKSENPKYMVVVFDSPEPSQREAIYKEYKAMRPPMPDPLKSQIPVIKELLSVMGVPTLEVPGFEADDVIAMLVKEFSDKLYIKIYTPDKDMLQLIGDRVIVINPINWETFDAAKVKKKFGVEPKKIPDFLALVGDKVDNVEGVKGIGPKTAVKVIEEFGDVNGILYRWEEFARRFPGADKAFLERAYTLVKPLDVKGFNVNENDVAVKNPDIDSLTVKLKELEMNSLLRDIESLVKKRAQGTLF